MNLPHWTTLFREADGSVSSARACMVLSIVIVLGTWSGLSIAKGAVLDIPGGPVTVVGMALGLKWLQQKGESDGLPPDEPPAN